jgi:hypothetical protein
MKKALDWISEHDEHGNRLEEKKRFIVHDPNRDILPEW